MIYFGKPLWEKLAKVIIVSLSKFGQADQVITLKSIGTKTMGYENHGLKTTTVDINTMIHLPNQG